MRSKATSGSGGIACRPRRSGNMRVERGRRRSGRLGMTRATWSIMHGIMRILRSILRWCIGSVRILGVCMICTGMWRSGCRTGMTLARLMRTPASASLGEGPSMGPMRTRDRRVAALNTPTSAMPTRASALYFTSRKTPKSWQRHRERKRLSYGGARRWRWCGLRGGSLIGGRLARGFGWVRMR